MRMSSKRGLPAALLGLLALAASRAAEAQIDVLTHHQDPARSGVNLKETSLTIDKVRSRFGKLCFRIVDGNVYAQPLVVTGAGIAGRAGAQNVVIVATEHNSVYAFDSDDLDRNSTKAQLWKADDSVFGRSIPSTTLSEDLGHGEGGCVDLTTEIGITSTPAILLTKATAPKEGLIYVVAKSLDTRHNYSFKLVVLGLSDGKPVGPPVTIAGDVAGKGLGSSGGRLAFDALHHHNRPALLIDDGTLYVCFCGHCDTAPFHGWVFAYDIKADPKAPKKLDQLCITPNINKDPELDGEGGIWMSGQGPSADGKGNIYLTTGNGSYDGKTDFGDCVLKLRLEGGKIAVKDHFVPKNEKELRIEDVDLGSAGVLLLPGSNLLIAGGKEGRWYLLDRDNLGKSIQDFQVTHPPAKLPKPNGRFDMRYWNIHGAPVAWKSRNGMFAYVCGEESAVKAYRLETTGAPPGLRFPFAMPDANPPTAFSDESAPFPGFPRPPDGTKREDVWMPGALLALTANGDDPKTGILWAVMPRSDNANHRVVRGVLRAFDAANFATRPGEGTGVPKQLVQIWASDHDNDASDDSLGMFAKFNPPTVANGRVYLATFQEENPAPGQGFQAHTVKQGGLSPALVIYGLK